LTENEVLQGLTNVRYYRGIEGVILAVELRFALQTPKFHVHCFLTHYQYFTIEVELLPQAIEPFGSPHQEGWKG